LLLTGTAFVACVAFAQASCGDDTSDLAPGDPDSSPADAGAASDAGTPRTDAGAADAGASDAGSADADSEAGPPDPCGSALFCDTFEDYAGVTAIADKQVLGPWHAALKAGAVMQLDSTHTASGSHALHVHIDNAATAGGRLFADGAPPIFAGSPTHLYGRMMMYIDPNGTSTHWTFFSVNGDAEPTSPVTGRKAAYYMSSLPKGGVNTYSFVYGLAAAGSDGYHDCYAQSATSMPSSWACISFEMDSVARKLRMSTDGVATPILAVDDHGKGCVAPTPATSPWYGPAVTQLFVGAWSYHPMVAPLDVWIDDVIVDTKPVICPTK
jgi:hypothetical protein